MMCWPEVINTRVESEEIKSEAGRSVLILVM